MCEVLERIEARGEANGEIRGTLKAIRSLMKKMGWPAEQAMDVLDIPPAERGIYEQELNF